jgi:hypothetical protein
MVFFCKNGLYVDHEMLTVILYTLRLSFPCQLLFVGVHATFDRHHLIPILFVSKDTLRTSYRDTPSVYSHLSLEA